MDNIYKIEFEDYTLEIIPSSEYEIGIANYIFLDSRIISKFNIKWDLGDLDVGIISPRMTLEFDYNIKDSNMTAFINILSYPTKEINIFGMNVKLKNVFKLWKGTELIYAGVQDTGIESNYDSSTYLHTIETTNFGRYVLEQFDTKVFQWLANNTVITPTVINSQSYVEYYNPTVLIDPRLTGHVPDNKNHYYWWYSLATLNEFYKIIIEYIVKALLRQTSYLLNQLFFNENQETMWKIFGMNEETTANIGQEYFKQTYDGSGLAGLRLTDDDLHFIGFRASDEYVVGEINITKKIDGLFQDGLNKSYKTMWDFMVDLTNQAQVILQPSGYFFKRVRTFSDSELFLYEVKAEFNYRELARVSASLTQSFGSDIDNYEVYTGSSRTDNSLTIPITFYNYPTADDYTTDVGSGWTNLFNCNKEHLRATRKVEKEHKFFGLYYIDQPSGFTKPTGFLIHSYVGGYDAMQYNQSSSSFDIAEALDMQVNSCIPKAVADYVMNKYNKKMILITANTLDNELYNFRTIFDVGILAPPNNPTIFDSEPTSFKVLSKTIDFIENTHEVRLLGYED